MSLRHDAALVNERRSLAGAEQSRAAEQQSRAVRAESRAGKAPELAGLLNNRQPRQPTTVRRQVLLDPTPEAPEPM